MMTIKEDAVKTIKHVMVREEDVIEEYRESIKKCLDEMERIIQDAKKANENGGYTMGEACLLAKKASTVELCNRNRQAAEIKLRALLDLVNDD